MFFGYWRWKRRAKRALQENRTTGPCARCGEPIFPDDLVAHVVTTEGEGVPVHAGFHPSLTERDAFCETGGLAGSVWDADSVWDGEQLVPVRGPITEAMRSGKAAIH